MPEGPERGQSPPPERSSGKQMLDVPASGQGTNHIPHKEDVNKEALEVGYACVYLEAPIADTNLSWETASDVEPQGSHG